MNLATQYLRDHNETLKDYDEDGLCGELANEVQKITPHSHIVGVSGVGVFDTTAWTYHTVVMVDGIIHDAWRKKVLPLEEWLLKFDCEWPIELSIDGKTVFVGIASEFQELRPLRRRLITNSIAHGC